MYKIHHLTSVITHSWPILFHLCVPPPWIVLEQISDMILSVPIAGKPRNRSSATLTMVTAASAWSSASSVERRVWPKGLFCCPNRNSVTRPGSHTEPVCFCLHLWRETGGFLIDPSHMGQSGGRNWVTVPTGRVGLLPSAHLLLLILSAECHRIKAILSTILSEILKIRVHRLWWLRMDFGMSRDFPLLCTKFCVNVWCIFLKGL